MTFDFLSDSRKNHSPLSNKKTDEGIKGPLNPHKRKESVEMARTKQKLKSALLLKNTRFDST